MPDEKNTPEILLKLIEDLPGYLETMHLSKKTTSLYAGVARNFAIGFVRSLDVGALIEAKAAHELHSQSSSLQLNKVWPYLQQLALRSGQALPPLHTLEPKLRFPAELAAFALEVTRRGQKFKPRILATLQWGMLKSHPKEVRFVWEGGKYKEHFIAFLGDDRFLVKTFYDWSGQPNLQTQQTKYLFPQIVGGLLPMSGAEFAAAARQGNAAFAEAQRQSSPTSSITKTVGAPEAATAGDPPGNSGTTLGN